MALITGSTTIDWSGVSLDPINVQQNFNEFAVRFSQAALELSNRQFVLNAPNTATFLSVTLNSGGLVTLVGSGLDLTKPASKPVIKSFSYGNATTGDVVVLTGTIDFVGKEVVTSLTIGFPGSQQTILGNISVDGTTGKASGTISQLEVTLGTAEITLKGRLVLSGNFDVSGTVTQISVVDGTNQITMSGLSLPYSALGSVTTASDLFTVVGTSLTGNDTITYANNSGVGMTFNGGAGNDTITISGANADTLNGGAGNDLLNGGAGGDSVNGGAGNDTYVVDSLGDNVTEATAGAAGGVDLVQSGVDFTLGANVENLTLTGAGNLNGTGNSLANILTGNSGNNQLSGGLLNDKLIGNGGDDMLDGGAGVDNMAGGLGNDTYVRDVATDVISEMLNAGTDTVQSSLNYTLGANLENLILTGSANLTGTGNVLNNTITGNSGNNTLTGLGGADTLIGGDGHDTVNGGLGNDQMDGGIGSDILIGDVGQDTVNGGLGDDRITMLVTAGNVDTIDAGADTDLLILSGVVGGNGVVVVDLSAADQVVSIAGIPTRDTQIQTGFEGVNGSLLGSSLAVTGSDGDNTIVGSKGNDSLNGGLGNDTMSGGLGNDSYIVDSVDDVVTEAAAAGTDKVFSSVSYTLGATVENMELTGSAAMNGTGNALANILTGNSGTNVLTGGLGNDTYVVQNDADSVVENLNAGMDLVQSTAANFTLGANVENLILMGSSNINGTGNTLANTLTGNSGNNTLDGMAGVDKMAGGLGDDSYVVDVAADVVTEAVNQGTDQVSASINYTLGANLENLTLTGVANLNGTGNALANELQGNDGNNILSGLVGNDTLNGGVGNDTLNGGVGGDNIQGGAGDDLILLGSTVEFAAGEAIDGGEDTDILRYTGASAATLTLTNLVTNIEQVQVANAAGLTTGVAAINVNAAAVANSLTLIGNNGANQLTGTSQADSLVGNAGNDSLIGGGGNDTLNGGLGNDSLIGGLGNDIYQVNRGNGQDTIVENDATVGNSDTLLYGATISPLNLVLSQQANHLRIALSGSTDSVTIQNWFTDPAAQIETIQTSNGQDLLNSQVAALIQDMAAFTASHNGLTWAAVAAGGGTAQQQTDFQTIIAANWQ
jgi:trimeric autotransporter adhesin